MQIINLLSLASLLSNINALYLSAEQHPITPPSQKQSISQPLIGFGTWNLNVSPENTTEAVAYAIEIGYRQIDCAAVYGNEVAVGRGIEEGLKRAGVKREDIWVTSKLWNDQYVMIVYIFHLVRWFGNDRSSEFGEKLTNGLVN